MSGEGTGIFDNIVRTLNGRAAPILAGAIFIGILWPAAAATFRPIFEATVVLMLTFPLLTLDWEAIGRQSRDWKLVVSLVGWQLLAAPLIVWTLCVLIEPPDDYRYMMLMAAAAPPIVSVAVFAAIVRLNAELALIAVVGTFAALPFTLLALDYLLPGFEIAFDLGAFALRVALFIILPFLIAWIARRLFGLERITKARESISLFGMINLIIFGIAAMDGVGVLLLRDAVSVLQVLVLAFTMNIGLQIVTGLAFLWRGRSIALTVGMCAGYRNMGVMWGISGGIGGPEFFLYVGMAQIPMYVLPAIAGPVYRRLMRERAHGMA